LYSVSVDALVDGRLSEPQVAATVIDHGEKGASDGLESDDGGRLYATNYEQNAVLRRVPDGQWETLVHDPRVLWPDTLSVARDGRRRTQQRTRGGFGPSMRGEWHSDGAGSASAWAAPRSWRHASGAAPWAWRVAAGSCSSTGCARSRRGSASSLGTILRPGSGR